MNKITSEEALRTLYGWPKGRAKDKVLDRLEDHSKHFLSQSPFAMISTIGTGGKMDASPRGGKPGFVQMLDDHTLVLPDSKGNNRVDSLCNIVKTGRIGLLFLIPGIDETLRINGAAYVTNDADLIARFAGERNVPRSCVVICVEEVFLHCAKALMRSKLWGADYALDRKDFPSMGRMLNDQLGTQVKEESHEEMVARYTPDL